MSNVPTPDDEPFQPDPEIPEEVPTEDGRTTEPATTGEPDPDDAG